MKLAVFGKRFETEYIDAITGLLDMLVIRGHDLLVGERFSRFLNEIGIALPAKAEIFHDHTEIEGADVMISIGGDGTLLDTLGVIRDKDIPVLGINTGRLGFLSNIPTDEIGQAIDALENQEYKIDERSLIKVDCPDLTDIDFPYALNEVTIHKKEDASMVTVDAYKDDKFINTYWADGLIVATPTGSTAYSLSCGGPIVMPGSENFILTPIAPHNLNVRPLVVPNDCKIRLRAEGRADEFLLTLDSHSYSLKAGAQVVLSTAAFRMKLIDMEDQHFFQTIRNKLLWGIDRRN
ncbi:MAG: NAD kinase [Flavobacteriales bacterium]|nr:NAD kinase [Flavobacteriales bacterium]